MKETVVWPLSLIQADKAHQLPNGKGQGVRICLIDTGVDQNRQGLPGVVLEGRNFLADGDSSDFSDSFPEHGTNLAEVIAGRPFGSFSGVAPEAKLVVAKVFDENGAGSMSSIIDALGYCMNRADIINMSFGGAVDSEILSTIMTTVKERGVTLIAAAGNTGDTLIFPAREIVQSSPLESLMRFQSPCLLQPGYSLGLCGSWAHYSSPRSAWKTRSSLWVKFFSSICHRG